MEHIFLLFGKDIKLFFKNTGAVIITFIVPMALILIFGMAFGGFGNESSIQPISLVLIDMDKTDYSKAFTTYLDSLNEIKTVKTYKKKSQVLPYDEKTLRNQIKEGKTKIGLIVPKGFKKNIINGKKPVIKILYDPKFMVEYGIVNGLTQKIMMSKFPQVLYNGMLEKSRKFLGEEKSQNFENDITDVVSKYFNIPKIPERNVISQGFSMEEEPFDIKTEKLVGEEKQNPMFAQSVAGMAVMFLLFSLSRAGASILYEKNKGTLNRLLLAPVNSTQIILSKLIFAAFLGIFQLSVMFIFGWLVFGLDIFSHIISLLVMILATSLAASALGMFIAAVSKNEAQVSGLTTLIALGMSALGGSMFPTIIMPDYMQKIGRFTLNYWAMDGFTNIFWRNLTLKNIYPDVLVLIGIFVVLTAVSVTIFEKKIFAK